MTLDEAIKYEEEAADSHRRIMKVRAITEYDLISANNHRQLAEWLKELKQLREQTTWISVNKKLPDPQKDGDKDYSEWVQITLHIGEDNDVVGRAFYCFSEKKWYTHGLGVGEVTVWMPLPAPYKPQERSEEE